MASRRAKFGEPAAAMRRLARLAEPVRPDCCHGPSCKHVVTDAPQGDGMMDGLDLTRVRTSMNRLPSMKTPEERDRDQRVLHQELLDNHGAVVVRLDQEPGCWADRMLFARGRIVVVRLDKLPWIPVFVAKYLRELAAIGWKRKGESEAA